MTTTLQDRLRLIRDEQASPAPEQPAAATPKPKGTATDAPSRPDADDPLGDLKIDVHKAVIGSLGPRLFRATKGSEATDLTEAVHEAVRQGLSQTPRPLSTAERAKLTEELTDDILGYGPITQFLRDESVSEIMVNNHSTVYIERRGKIVKTNARFVDEAHLERIIDKIVSEIGRRIDESSPMVDARLPDGSRVNAIIPPLAVNGSCLTIRKFRADPLTIEDLISFGTLTPKSAEFLQQCVKGAANVLIVGGTGSGKTTTLNVLSSAIPDDQRIITVEDAAELQLKQEHVITLEARPANTEGKGKVEIRDLVRNCLRMRPDRIVVGECRGGEAVDMLQAMNTGHDGSMTTVHANSPREAMSRLETLVLMAGVELPVRAIREQICGAIDVVVQVERLVDGTRRITHITEVGKMEGDMITLQDIFIAKSAEDDAGVGGTTALLGPLRSTGLKPHFLDKLAANGVKLAPGIFSEDDDLRSRRDSRWILGDKQAGAAERR